MNAIEPKVRRFCVRTLEPLVGAGGLDFVRDLGAVLPMLTIGMLLGIPEQDQEAIRDRIHESLKVDGAHAAPTNDVMADRSGMLAEYVEWRAQHPSDDLTTELLTIEFEDEPTPAAASAATRSSATCSCSPAPATTPPPSSSAGWASSSATTPTSAGPWPPTAR
jgi:cytochrome P450